MKKILGLFFLILFGSKGFALDRDGRIIITYPHSQGVWVDVDGRQYNGYNNSVVISNLSPGRHRVRVYSRDSRNSGIFGIFGNRERIIYSNTLNLKPGYHVYVEIDRNGKARVNERRMMDKKEDRRDWDNRGRENRDWDFRGRDDRDRRNQDRDDNRQYDDYGRGNVSHGNFMRMIQDLRGEHNEQRRFGLAKQYVSSYSYTSAQVKQILQLFNHDNEKLDLAKDAYRLAVDKRNYSELMDVFRSKKSRRELEKYIKNDS